MLTPYNSSSQHILDSDGMREGILPCTPVSTLRGSSPILIGEPGFGTSAIAEGLAQHIFNHDVPASLLGRLYSLDMGAFMVGAKFMSEYEDRVKAVLNEVEKAAQEGTTEYRQSIEKDPALERQFAQMLVNEPSVPETIPPWIRDNDPRPPLPHVKTKLQPLQVQHEAEKARGEEIQNVCQKMDELKTKVDEAKRCYDLHYAPPDLHAHLQQLKVKEVDDLGATFLNGMGDSPARPETRELTRELSPSYTQ
ncbi:uncharacterized protein B0H18DRAFT_1116156 [Fomitopsis serialis]|uniref:uncharacterized protein n=1 Tax=Fomitopsis serialis TaxID=139415 RepID=UPI0020089B10|nr:uncharacterized protein B0H18DRAFT_1116156 [Neoantrodia serialis]KAH9931911.1 hypothetical protein B0H18DRAFT_1116156 [Neoantrodia serialis]